MLTRPIKQVREPVNHISAHGQRSLVGYSPWGHKESDITEQLTIIFYLATLHQS